MDLQGTPIGGTNQGTKNTTDPRAQKDPINESAGFIASDSLAAESTNAGGGFSDNRNAKPSGVKGASSTATNTDTTGATILPASASATIRDSGDDATSGLDYSTTSGKSGTSDSSSGGNSHAAPSYINSVVDSERGGKPKGKNLQEGGFAGVGQNNKAEIGSKNDPGRVGLQKMAQQTAVAPGGPSAVDSEVSNDGQYESLDNETAA